MKGNPGVGSGGRPSGPISWCRGAGAGDLVTQQCGRFAGIS